MTVPHNAMIAKTLLVLAELYPEYSEMPVSLNFIISILKSYSTKYREKFPTGSALFIYSDQAYYKAKKQIVQNSNILYYTKNLQIKLASKDRTYYMKADLNNENFSSLKINLVDDQMLKEVIHNTNVGTPRKDFFINLTEVTRVDLHGKPWPVAAANNNLRENTNSLTASLSSYNLNYSGGSNFTFFEKASSPNSPTNSVTSSGSDTIDNFSSSSDVSTEEEIFVQSTVLGKRPRSSLNMNNPSLENMSYSFQKIESQLRNVFTDLATGKYIEANPEQLTSIIEILAKLKQQMNTIASAIDDIHCQTSALVTQRKELQITLPPDSLSTDIETGNSFSSSLMFQENEDISPSLVSTPNDEPMNEENMESFVDSFFAPG